MLLVSGFIVYLLVSLFYSIDGQKCNGNNFFCFIQSGEYPFVTKQRKQKTNKRQFITLKGLKLRRLYVKPPPYVVEVIDIAHIVLSSTLFRVAIISFFGSYGYDRSFLVVQFHEDN